MSGTCPVCGKHRFNCTCKKWFRFLMAAICNRCGNTASHCTCKRGA